jgi:hypothetical protein
MNVRISPTILFGLGLALALAPASSASAQDALNPPQAGSPTKGQSDTGNGQRGGGRGWGSGNAMGRGTVGTVTEVTSDHYTIKTETGETYTVHYSANTRILKQQPRPRGENGASAGGEGGNRGPANPPTPLKATDIKVGDAVAAMGEVDASAKSVGATMVLQIDPERAKQMREMEANYGKTWLMGRVTAIDGVKVTLSGAVDHTPHTFVADENTTFRKRRDPITLADIQVGDNVRVEGAVKDGSFLASSVNAMGQPPAGAPTVPGNAGPP